MSPHFVCKLATTSRQEKHARNVSKILYESHILEAKNDRTLSIETFIEFYTASPQILFQNWSHSISLGMVPFSSPANTLAF